MFAVCIMENKETQGMGARFLDRLRRRPIKMELCAAGGASFWLLTCPQSPKGIDYTQLSQLLGTHRNHIVCSKSFLLPAHLQLRRFIPTAYSSQLCIKAAAYTLEHSHMELYQRVVGVVDVDAHYQSCIAPLIHHCTLLKIYTGQPQRYQAFAQSIMQQYGAPVQICTEIESLASCVLTVAPVHHPILHSLQGSLVLCPQGAAGQGSSTAGQFTVKLPTDFGDRLPTPLDSMYFLAALYQLGNLPQMANLPLHRCRIDGRLADITQLAQLAKSRAGQLTQAVIVGST